MRERPIIFSGEMVRAILSGRKTQTRRVMNPQPPLGTPVPYSLLKSPFVTGDRLWVREEFREVARGRSPGFVRYGCAYSADDATRWNEHETEVRVMGSDEEWIAHLGEPKPWKRSIHMPRWASRITLEVTNVRVERVQDISEQDAIAEGVEQPICSALGFGRLPKGRDCSRGPHRHAFRSLWNNINAKRGFGWRANPWVWVVEFRVLDPEVKP